MTRTPGRPRGDHSDEMLPLHLLDEDTVEALLTGRPVTPGLAPLAGAVGELRAAARQPARPSAELAQRMAAGDFSGIAPVPPALEPHGRRLRSWLAGVSPRVRAVTGAVVVFTGLTAATATGALPGGAQAHLESFIETVTPISFQADEPGTDVVEDVRDTGRPDDPGESVRPPGKPETPPEKPETPGNPNKPETPPGKPPEKPDNPNKPESPPGTPEKPEKPEKPENQGNENGNSGHGNSGNNGNGQGNGNSGNGNNGNGNRNGP